MTRAGDPWPHLDINRSKVKVTRPLNPVAENQSYLRNGKVYELQTWYTDGVWRPASSTCAVTSKVKGQDCNVTSSVWRVFAHKSTKASQILAATATQLPNKFWVPLRLPIRFALERPDSVWHDACFNNVRRDPIPSVSPEFIHEPKRYDASSSSSFPFIYQVDIRNLNYSELQ